MFSEVVVKFENVGITFSKNKGTPGVILSLLRAFERWCQERKFFGHTTLLSMVKGILRGWNPAEKVILKDLSFEIRQGEVVSLFAANGSGKSTILNIICGAYSCTAGTVSVHGKSPFADEVRGRVLKVGPNVALFGDFTPIEVMVSFALWYRLDPHEVSILAPKLLKALGVKEQDVQSRCEHLSSGTKLKVLFLSQLLVVLVNARITGEPAVLLLDEPTATLDPTSIYRFVKAVKAVKIAFPELTIIMATNDPNLVEISTRLIALREDQVVTGDDKISEIQAGLKSYQQSVIVPARDLIDSGEMEQFEEFPEIPVVRHTTVNPVAWRSLKEIRVNYLLSFFLVLSLLMPNLIPLFMKGPSWSAILLTSAGIFYTCINRSGYRVLDMERNYFKNLMGMLLSPVSRFQHISMHALSSLRHNLIYSSVVAIVLWGLYRQDLCDLTISRFGASNLGIIALIMVVCWPFAYGIGLLVSTIPFIMRENNYFFFMTIIPLLAFMTSGFYYPVENLPWILPKFAMYNPLTYLAAAIELRASVADWSLLAKAATLSGAWLLIGFGVHCLGFKVARLSNRFTEAL